MFGETSQGVPPWDLQVRWMYEETISLAVPSLNKTGLSLVLLSRKALDLHGHRFTHSPEGRRPCLSYLICPCWGFYTCVLDNWPRHCRSKKAPIWNKRLKAPRRIVRQPCAPMYSPGFLSPFLFFVCIYLPFWAPTGLCRDAHHCCCKERQWRGGASPGAGPPGQAASLLLW